MEFRLAELSDLDTVSTLFRLAVEKMIQERVFQWDEIYPDVQTLKNDILQKEMFVGVEENQIVSVYVLNTQSDPEYQSGVWQIPENYKIIHRLCIRPDFQNQGLAVQTMLHIEKTLKAEKFAAVRLDAFVHNPAALHLYQKLSYQIVGCVTWRKGSFYLMEKIL